MDNLTHSLVGLAASKAGLEKLSPHTSLFSVLIASAPDADIVVLLFGDRWTFLQHHRGITHSIIGTLLLGLTLPVVFYALDRLAARVRRRQPTVKLKGLMVASVIVCATHPILDWTNNYGVRPFLPWSSQWFYGDFVFIIDPLIWLILGGACFLLISRTKLQMSFWLLLGGILTFLVVAAPTQRGFESTFAIKAVWVIAMVLLIAARNLEALSRRSRKIATVACALVIAYMASLAIVHHTARAEAAVVGRSIANQNGESVTDVAAMPTLENPTLWVCVVETERAAYRFQISLIRSGSVSTPIRHERADTFNSPVVNRAAQDRSAKIFLDFARFPVARVKDEDCITQTLVQFADLRYTEPGRARGTFSLEVPVECPPEDAAKQK